MQATDPGARGRRNLVLGCVGCGVVAAALMALAMVVVFVVGGKLGAWITGDRLTRLHTRVLEVEAADEDREMVLVRLDELRDRSARQRGFFARMSAIDAMERLTRDGYLTPSEARFIARELERL